MGRDYEVAGADSVGRGIRRFEPAVRHWQMVQDILLGNGYPD